MIKKLGKDWVSTSELAKILDCSIDLIYKLRDEGLFIKNKHWRILNPTAARVTYRWHLTKCQDTIQSYEATD